MPVIYRGYNPPERGTPICMMETKPKPRIGRYKRRRNSDTAQRIYEHLVRLAELGDVVRQARQIGEIVGVPSSGVPKTIQNLAAKGLIKILDVKKGMGGGWQIEIVATGKRTAPL